MGGDQVGVVALLEPVDGHQDGGSAWKSACNACRRPPVWTRLVLDLHRGHVVVRTADEVDLPDLRVRQMCRRLGMSRRGEAEPIPQSSHPRT